MITFKYTLFVKARQTVLDKKTHPDYNCRKWEYMETMDYLVPGSFDQNIENGEFTASVINNCKILGIGTTSALIDRMRKRDKAFMNIFSRPIRDEVRNVLRKRGIYPEMVSEFYPLTILQPIFLN